jgi:DNA gyrase/topoisomerase IV subunit B
MRQWVVIVIPLVDINEDGSTVEDNGRIPVGIHKKEGVSALRL